jgi:hypothetical protein
LPIDEQLIDAAGSASTAFITTTYDIVTIPKI